MQKIHVKSIYAANFGPITELQADFETHDVLIVKGGNGRGKTTFIEGFFSVLRQKFPDCPLKQGATKGGMSIDLTDGTTITFDAANKSLSVTNEGGKMGANSAKDYLRRLLGNYGGGFSINDFIQTTAPKQRLEMLKTLTLQSGSDLSEIDRANNTYKSAFTDRTDSGRVLDAQKARVKPFDPELAEKHLVDAAELAGQRSAIEKHNDTYYQSQAALTQIEAQVAEFPQTKASLGADMLTLESDYQTELARLKKKFDADCEALKVRQQSVEDAEKVATERLERAQKWINDPANAPKETTAIDTQLQELTAINEAINEAKRMKAESDKLAELQVDYDRKNEAVARAEQARKQAIADCALPAGLSFDDSGESLLLNGLPLEAASAAEKTVVAIELQLSQMGELGFISCDLSHLDPEKLESVVAWLRENDLQAAIEIAARTKSEMGLQVQIFEDYIA